MFMYTNVLSLKNFLISMLLSLVAFNLQAQPLQKNIDQLIEKSFPHANIGVFIKDAQSGKILYQHNGNKLLNPASNIKMLTGAAALYHLGPKDRYITGLAKDQNNIYISFTGSPAFTTNDLKQLLQQLNQLGITTITGNVVLDTSQFKPPYHAAGTSYDDIGWYYDAPSTAVMLNGNAVTYDVVSAKTLGKLIEIKSKAPHQPLNIINNVITVNKAQEKEHCSLHIEVQANNTLRLYGCLAQEDTPQKMQLAIPDPILYAKQSIKTVLKENNILLKGNVIEGRKPVQAQALTAHQSDDLHKLITYMLLESDNLYADSITKRLAYSLTGEGTYKQGAFAIKHILAKHTHLDMKQMEITDGLGTRYNMITPQQMVIFLTDLYHDRKMKPLFLSALPQMGVSGTLKDRMKETGLEHHVLAKTGSMHDISALSGYLLLPTGKTIIFSIICNGITGDLWKAKKLEEKILLAVYKS